MNTGRQAPLGGRYRLRDVIGEGAMGTVVRAHDELLGRTVAVKLLRAAYAHDAAFIARFAGEARAAAQIADPHVVTVHDVLDVCGTHAIVMEYVSGPSLAAVLRREGRIDEVRAVRYVRHAAAGLAAAHARGLVHRDVKPANLLLTSDDIVKVADFGVATAMARDIAVTEPGRIMGSVAYISPEQARERPLGPASDLYSLGVVLHELVTGALPFTARSAVEMAVAHVATPPPSRRELRRRMSPPLAAIVHRLLRKDPAERYTTALALIAALDALPASPRSGSRFGGAARILDAWRGTALVVAAALLLVIGVAWSARPRAAVVVPPPARLVTLPNLTGMPLGNAALAMQRLDLHATITARAADTQPNTVIAQDPPPGTRLRAGSAAFVVISSGPQSAIGPTTPFAPPGWRKHGRHGHHRDEDEGD